MKALLVSALVVGFAALVALVAWPSEAPAGGPPTADDVGSELMCQCGCSMTVATCIQAMTCTMAEGMMADIQTQLDAGKSKGEILDGFVSQYGESILATPRKSGFSLTAWLTPFAALIVGAAVVSWAVWAWTRRRPLKPQEPMMVGKEQLNAYEERVERELDLLD
jgi:cytochrome c-type biogenesis protein CcmH